MNFSWIWQAPDQGWWANYRWHITEPSEKLGLKPDNWKKSFFRSGWQSKTLEIDSVDKVKKCLQGLQNGTITAYGGRFRGASYDKNVELIIKQTKRSLKKAIEKHDEEGNINVKETAIVPLSYYRWGRIFLASVAVIAILGLVGIIWWKKTKRSNKNQT